MDPHAACRVLGVPPGASEADVKSAYRNAAMKFHPDRNAGLGADAERVAAERFRRASEAYDVLSHRGGAPGGSSSSRYASHARKPPSGGGHSDQSSQRKSGYYNGAADPFGFRYKRSDRVGDHMRRIDGNIRALYATLALVGVALYLAPQPSSPAETARRRRRADRSTHAFVERAVPSLAPGSPLDSNERTLNARAFEGTRTMNSTHSGITDYRRTSGKTNEPHVSVRHARFDDALENDATFRYAYGGGGEMRARPMARQNAYGSAGERAFAEARTRALLQKKETRGDEDVDAVATHGPEWANGGYAGRGVSRRVLPYRRRRFDRDAPGAARGVEDEDGDSDGDSDAASSETRTGIACARCHCALPLTARFCSICGARVTSPASVVATAAGTRAVPPEPKRKQSTPRATPLADPQDTGSSAGRGRARAAADRELNAGAEAFDDRVRFHRNP